MKSSNYNTFIEYENEWIAHNGLTNSLVLLTDTEMKGFNEYLETGYGLNVEQILDFKKMDF